jgi:DNA-binding beta-propeller fold protein YncE
MQEFVSKLLFLFAVAALAFAYGFVSHWKQIFPYELLRDANIAFDALLQARKEAVRLKNLDFWDDSGITGPVYKLNSATGIDENVFILGNDLAYGDASTGASYLAWIADRSGKVLHAWRDPGEIWAPLQDRSSVGGDWRSYPVGAHLFANGDILVSYQGVNVFPISMGIARFDKDSNLVWKNTGLFHHWFTVGPDDEIYVPDTVLAASPMAFPDHRKSIVCEQGTVVYDALAILDANGTRIRTIDLLAALVNSDLLGLINTAGQHSTEIRTCDPLHLNDIQVLDAAKAAEFPGLDPGDLLLSFRSLNAIGVLDPDTETFKWFYVGAPHEQHSARFYTDNRILLFDNYGGRISRGTSRVLSVNLGSSLAETVFPRPDSSLPQHAFYSDTAGHIDIDPAGNRVLVAFTHQGLVLEIDAGTGEVLWEFVNTHPVDGRPGRVSVYTAKYAGGIAFPMNSGELH